MAEQCMPQHGHLYSAWKLRGDIALQLGGITPGPATPEELPEFRSAPTQLGRMESRVRGAVSGERHIYCN